MFCIHILLLCISYVCIYKYINIYIAICILLSIPRIFFILLVSCWASVPLRVSIMYVLWIYLICTGIYIYILISIWVLSFKYSTYLPWVYIREWCISPIQLVPCFPALLERVVTTTPLRIFLWDTLYLQILCTAPKFIICYFPAHSNI